ncbi:alpha/beta fold hydrolase [Tabrizicola sp.]|uniref:alpha/beta fold hydrolase n=1 Tax=Tabrizicola sp. TaxID=2005166 RepID=UPI003F37C5BB
MRYVVGLLTILIFAAGLALIGLRLAASIREIGLLPEKPPEEGRIVETTFGPIYVEELGPEDGPPLLLLHGSIGWSRMWRPTQEALAAEGYRAIAFDIPPMGFSFRDPGKDYSRKTQAQRVVALTEALGVRPVLIAHSFGAGPAAEAAMLQPDAFAGIVVVSGAIGIDSHLEELSLTWPLGNPTAREFAISATATNPMAMGPLLKRFLHRKEAATEEVIAMLNRPSSRAGTTQALADWLPSLLVPPKDAQSTRPEAWQALTLPVAFIWGDRDTTTPLAQGERLAELTGAPLSILKDVGHIPQIEAPPEFQAALISALATMIPPAP